MSEDLIFVEQREENGLTIGLARKRLARPGSASWVWFVSDKLGGRAMGAAYSREAAEEEIDKAKSRTSGSQDG